MKTAKNGKNSEIFFAVPRTAWVAGV